MTNAEKFKEVFGFYPDVDSCVMINPCCTCKYEDFNDLQSDCANKFWNDEYKGNDTVKVEVTEVHTFAKPDDVEDIKFGDD